MTKTLRLCRIALMAVVISLCSWLTIPFIVPFTMQTFGIACALLFLGGRDGAKAVLLYILMGVVGIPVFSGFTAGIGRLVGATGGYISGFLLMALIYSIITGKFGYKKKIKAVALFAGLAGCYVFGTLWFVFGYSSGEKISIVSALSMCVLPFIIPDTVKILLALSLEKALKRIIDKK